MTKSGLIFLSISRVVLAQESPAHLGQMWVEAIKENSIERIKPLIHPDCPKDSVKPFMLERLIKGPLPPRLEFETKSLGPKENLEKVYQVIPEQQLNLNYLTGTPEERKKFGLGKGFPIAKKEKRWFFVLCTK